MTYEFLSLDEFLTSFEREYINLLNEYDLLDKFNPDAKKIFMYLFINKFNEVLQNPKLLLYYNQRISDDHEVLLYCPKDKFQTFLHRLCAKLRKITGRVFYISKKIKIPSQAPMGQLDGTIQDEVILLNDVEITPQKLKEFLHKHNLKELFDSLARRVG